MTTVWDEFTNALGDRLADDLRDMVRRYEAGAERSRQRHIGPSQLGNPCTRCLARQVLGCPIVRQFDDPWCRILGTAGHAWLDDAATFDNASTLTADGSERAPRWHPEQRVHPHPDLLPSGGKTDLFDEQTGTVIDHKILGVPSLKKIKLNGPGPQYRVQLHVYGLGCHRLGLTVNNVALAAWPRGGRLSDLYVWTEPYDVQIALDALMRLRTIQEQANAIGPAILPLLPAHPDCWDCEGKDIDPAEVAGLVSQHLNPTGSTASNAA